MRKILLFLLTLFMLGSCADEFTHNTSAESESNSNQMFSYDLITNPEV